MLEKLKQLLVRHYDLLSYLVFGVLTTLVNYLIYYPCLNLFCLSASVSNIIAWIFAVAFAYLTNKPFVFRSHDWSAKAVLPELTKFVSCRVGSGALETAILFVTVDWLRWDGNLWKIITSVLVVVVNYIVSTKFVFKK